MEAGAVVFFTVTNRCGTANGAHQIETTSTRPSHSTHTMRVVDATDAMKLKNDMNGHAAPAAAGRLGGLALSKVTLAHVVEPSIYAIDATH